MNGLDSVALNFSPSSLVVLNIILGLVMYGIALGIRTDDFRRVLRVRRALIIGLSGQFIVLPAVTFVLIQLVRPEPSIALGMILVAACPGGNISNFFTQHALGNAALSVSMSAVSTAAAIVMTPLNLAFWGGLDHETAAILRAVDIDPLFIVFVITLIMGVPLVLGMATARYWPAVAARMRDPFRLLSMMFFVLFVLGALVANFQNFLDHVGAVALIVLTHNGLAIASGYWLARVSGMPEYDRRAVAIEVGIQNSGLGLVLIFNFFDGLGGMAIITAWWGIWHIVSGMTLATLWRRYAPAVAG